MSKDIVEVIAVGVLASSSVIAGEGGDDGDAGRDLFAKRRR